MIVEQRMYKLCVVKISEVHEREGLPILRTHLGHQVSF